MGTCFTTKDILPTHMPPAPHMELGGRRTGSVQLDHRLPGRGKGWAGGKTFNYRSMVLLVCCYCDGSPHPIPGLQGINSWIAELFPSPVG